MIRIKAKKNEYTHNSNVGAILSAVAAALSAREQNKVSNCTL